MSRSLIFAPSLAAIAILPLFAGQDSASGKEPIASSAFAEPIEVSVCCIELDLAALRGLGVQFDTSKATMQKLAKHRPAELRRLIEGLASTGCARSTIKPTVVTHSGREASVQVGHAYLKTKPFRLDRDQIELSIDCKMQRPIGSIQPNLPPTRNQFAFAFSTLAAPGETICVSHPGNSVAVYGDRQSDELAAFVFVTVNVLTEPPAAPVALAPTSLAPEVLGPQVAPYRQSEIPSLLPRVFR